MKKLIIFLCLLTLTACASGVQKMRKIDPGMTTYQVEEIMGERDGFSTVEKDGSSFTLYKYTNQFCNAHVSLKEKCDFYIIFKDNKVIETGVNDVRQIPSNMQFIHIFKY